ncbi:cadherin repeat domain-containing protein [Cyanothece sp. BG0011]|uniref:cadherin repeat domain-containing protein n=1 Tax=Cyanothece sp. BG0011 TaxID=2082950 RepID=UPI000D1D618E|nr:cadherin repeat domain-containing protein [Cyanothece sp. BG0011]
MTNKQTPQQSTVPDAGNTLGDALDLGLLSYSITNPLTIPILTELSEFVGGDDSDDYFQFSLDNTAGVSAGWTSSESITVELLDSNGSLIKSLSGGNTFSNDVLFENLDTGTYYLHLLTGNSTVSNYDLNLLVGPTDNVDNVSQTPKDLGILTNTSVNESDYVHFLYGGSNGIQDDDTYRFTLTQPSLVDFTWTDGVGDNTTIQLGSGFGSFDFLENNNSQQTVSYQRTLGAGTYEFSIFGGGAFNPTESAFPPASYDLTLTASEPPDAGNSLGDAQNLGLFSYSANPLSFPILEEISEFVGGDDTDDYFSFTLNSIETPLLPVGVSVGWSSSEPITVELLDNNGTLIKSLSGTNRNADDVLFENLNAGFYYLHLLTGDSTVSNYDVQLLIGPTDNVDNVSQTAKDLGVLTSLPSIIDAQSDYVHFLYGDSNGIQDTDTYKFTLTQASVVDFTWTDGVGDNTTIQLGSGFGSFDFLENNNSQQTVSYQRTLEAGTYEFSISGGGAFNPTESGFPPASYNLTLTANLPPDAGNSLDNARNLELFSYSINSPLGTPGIPIPILEEFSEFVGGDDSDDYYQFTILNTNLNSTVGVSAGWSSSEDITVELLDSNGTLIKSLSGTNRNADDVLFENLDTGTYYLHLLTGTNTVSNYDFQLLFGPNDNVDNVSQTPKDLGVLTNSSVSESDYVHFLYGVDTGNGIQDSDTYSFTLTQASVVDFTWTDGVGDNTTILLGSGFANFEFLDNDESQQTVSYQRTLGAGNYEFSISGGGAFNPTESAFPPASYDLTLTASEPPNQPPTNLTLSNNTIDENQPINTTVGTFTTTDPDLGDTFTYSLVMGDGDTHNNLFTINGNTLQTNTIFDFESQNSYDIRVQTTDSANNTYSESFTVTINDLNDSTQPVTLELNLYQDNNGVLGDFINADEAILGDNFFLEVKLGDIRPNAAGLVAAAIDLGFAPDVAQNINNFADLTSIITSDFPLFPSGTVNNTTGNIENLGASALPPSFGSVIGVNQSDRFALLHFTTIDTRDDSQVVLNLDPTQTGYADGLFADPSNTELSRTLIINDAPELNAIADTTLSETATVGIVIVADNLVTATDDEFGDPLTFTLTTSPIDGNGNALFAIDANTGEITLTQAGADTIDFESGVTSYNLGLTASDGFKTSTEETFTVNLLDENEAMMRVFLPNGEEATGMNDIIFTTELSRFRTDGNGDPVADSEFIRPNFADTFKFIDILNDATGTEEVLQITELNLLNNLTGVSIDAPEADILINPGETRRFFLTYAPDTAGENFSEDNGLTIVSNASNDPNFNVHLAGKSTFNSDVSYDGQVNLTDLGVLQRPGLFGSQNGQSNYDPTADITGDGVINLAELVPLNAEFGSSVI